MLEGREERLYVRLFIILGCGALLIRGADVTDRCVEESPAFRFTFPWSGSNSTCYGLCYSSVNAAQYDNRTYAFSCEAVVKAGYQDIICSKCPKNCPDACMNFTTSVPTSVPTF
mmetsp:Transcript_14899/g.22432  ORF Transcript_14899/g.22432 Transcript_14899/m.22432 type:complete len:114 (-) Transcript_14899:2112-2453(-)